MPEIAHGRPNPPRLQSVVRRKLASGIFRGANQPNVWEVGKLTQISCRYHELGQFKYRYTPQGQYATVTFPNGQSRNYSYDWAGRLLQLANLHPTAGNLATYSYGYDVDWATGLKTRKGQRTSMTADVPVQGFANALTKYYYDSFYQLTGADYPSAAPFNGELARWTYDAIANRTSETVNGVTANYTYQKIGANPKNWQRLTGDGSNTYTHDSFGAITGVVGPRASQWTYDIEGKLATRYAGSLMAFQYDGRGRLARIADAGSETRSLLMSGPVVVGTASASATTWYLNGDEIDEPLASGSGGVVTFAVTDALGSVSVQSSSDGAIVGASAFDAWGTVRSRVGQPVRVGFNGRDSLDLNRPQWEFRARIYDSNIGRFLEEDPLRFAAGSTFYGFALNNPILNRDPFGLFTLPAPTDRRFRKCRTLRKGYAQQELERRRQNPGCRNFFRNTCKSDIDRLFRDPLPRIELVPEGTGRGQRESGGAFDPSRPDVITISMRECKSMEDFAHTLLHELGHYADFHYNNDSISNQNHGDGCNAEIECFGYTSGINCRDLGFRPYKPVKRQ